jgi:hypothetical protein
MPTISFIVYATSSSSHLIIGCNCFISAAIRSEQHLAFEPSDAGRGATAGLRRSAALNPLILLILRLVRLVRVACLPLVDESDRWHLLRANVCSHSRFHLLVFEIVESFGFHSPSHQK